MLSLAGCATQPPSMPTLMPLQYTSTPSGALVIRDGVVLGRTPFVKLARMPKDLFLVTQDGRKLPRCGSVRNFTFRWASGATAVVDACRDLTVVTASRPADAPGLDQDLLVQDKLIKASHQLEPTYWPWEYGRLGLPGANSGLVSGL